MEQIDYTKIVPTQPPDGFMEWFRQKNNDDVEYLVYRAAWYTDPLSGEKIIGVECKCTWCTETSLMQRIDAPTCGRGCASAPFGFFNDRTSEAVISGDTTVCPVCGNPVEAIHISNIGNSCNVCKTVSVYHLMTIERHGGQLMLLAWCVKRLLNKAGSIKTKVLPYEAYIAEERKIVKLAGYRIGAYGSIRLTGEWAQRKRYNDSFREIMPHAIYPWNPQILIGTSAENCKLDVYLKSVGNRNSAYPVTYLNLWIKNNNVENLIMTGAGKLINNMIEIYCFTSYNRSMGALSNIHCLDLKRVKPHDIVGLTKQDYKDAVRMQWDCKELVYYKQVRCHCIKPHMVRETMKVIPPYIIEEIEGYENDFSRIYRYILRQKKKYPDITPEPSVDILSDYWRMAVERGYDFNDINIRYPQNIIRSHDTLASEIKYEQDKEKERLFVERFNALYKFSYCTDEFEIHPARSPEEMVHEGKVLHHCVGSYVDSHANGKTAIFFIRRRNVPDKPYYTLELDVKSLTVRQNRGRGNCARTEAIKKFEGKWLEHIKSQSINNIA